MIIDVHSHDFPDQIATRAMNGMCRMTEGDLWPAADISWKDLTGLCGPREIAILLKNVRGLKFIAAHLGGGSEA